jgi:signal transduction histidine kinase
MDSLSATRERVDCAASDPDRLAALLDLASALYEYDAAEAALVSDQAIALADLLGDQSSRAWARHHRAWSVAALGLLDEALEEHLAVLQEFEVHNDHRGVAHSLMAIGDIHSDAGDTTIALEYLERAAGPMQAAGDRAGQAVVLNLTGIALGHEGRHRDAASLFEEAEKLFTDLEDPLRITMTKINRGFELLALAYDEADPTSKAVADAANLASDAIEMGNALGEDGRSTLAYGRSLMALAHAAAGRRDLALDESAAAHKVAKDGGFDALAAEIALDRIGWLTGDGRLGEAQHLLDEVEAISTTSDNRRCLAKASELRADILEALGDHQAALVAYRTFHAMDRTLHSDASERRAHLTSAQFQVERAIRETELAKLRVAELEALDHDKRDFLASVSHELRTPLAAVLGFATELAEAWDGFAPEEARGLVRLIAKQSADISSIVDDLLTITRLEAGTMSVYPKALDVRDNLAPLVTALAREANRPVDWTGNALVWADATRLRQVIRNLVSNAFRYGGEKVRVEVYEEDRTAHIEVRDSGGPIPENRVATMFEPFDHSDDDGRTPNSVGLGLAVARSLARMMEGDLIYVYQDGESVFRLTLHKPLETAARLSGGAAASVAGPAT